MVDRRYDIPDMLFLYAICDVRPFGSLLILVFSLTPPRMYVHETQLSTMTATWLLPIVATIVAAASGGIVAEVLPNPQHALWTVIISYILWGTGVPLAMAVLVIYFQRLTIYKLPPREVIVSVFLPLGPLGQGGFGIMQLGKVAMEIFPKTKTLQSTATNSGEILYIIGWLVATIMWGFGLVWLFFAAASISRSKPPFNMGWWGFTFPLGVFTTSTTMMAKELPSTFFKVLGTVRDARRVVSCGMSVADTKTTDIFSGRDTPLDHGICPNCEKGIHWRYVLRALLEGP
jgi:tellurite resistance protein TehA-like permease